MDEHKNTVDPEQSTDDASQTPLNDDDIFKSALINQIEPETDEKDDGNQEPEKPEESEPKKDVEDEFAFLEDEKSGEQDDSKGVQKRIDKLTREKYELKDEIRELEAQLKSAQSQPQDASVPKLYEVEDISQLRAVEAQYQHWADFAKQALLEYKRDPDKVEEELTKAVPEWRSATEDPEFYLENTLLNVERELRNVPKAEKHLEQRNEARAKAVEKFGYLNDPTDKRTQWIESKKNQYPMLKTAGETDMLLAYALEGMKAERARNNSVGKVATDPTTQPRKPSQKSTGANDDLTKARKRVLESRDRSDAINYFQHVLGQV